MMGKKSNGLSPIQKAEMGILKQVLDICHQNNIPYFMLGGTLLGAIRHKGFIPWDDDIDIGIPRPYYEQFLKIAANSLKKPYSLCCYERNAKRHQQYFAKIVNQSISVCKLKTDFKTIESVWIDIFPLDGVPSNKIKQLFWSNYCLVLAKLFTLSQLRYEFDRKKTLFSSKSNTKKTIRLFLKFRLDYLLNANYLWNKLDRHLRKYNYQESTSIVNLCGHWHMKEMFPKAYYGIGAYYSFEDLELKGPVNYDGVLSQMYGDYMKLPPENKRDAHAIEIVDF